MYGDWTESTVKDDWQLRSTPLIEELHAAAAAEEAAAGDTRAVGTPVVVAGELIESAWGNQVRADLLSHDTSIAARVLRSGDTFTGTATVGSDPGTWQGVSLRTDGAVIGTVVGTSGGGTGTSGLPSLVLTRAAPGASDPGAQFAAFRRSAGGVAAWALIGSITIATGGAAVVYNTSSDERLKEVLGDLDGRALAIVEQLRPVRFVWRGDDDRNEVAGFLAHEVDALVPHAVQGERGAVDYEGRIVPQQLSLSDLVPYLVAAIKALAARLDDLESVSP